jgi:hypothetical protein
LLRGLRDIQDFIRGSVVVLKRPCTYPGCRRCAEGLKHPAVYHTVSQDGKTQTTYLGASLAEQARGQVAAYKRLLGLWEEVSQINLTLLTGKER